MFEPCYGAKFQLNFQLLAGIKADSLVGNNHHLRRLVFCTTAVFTSLAGVETGICCGAGLSLALVLYKTAFPKVTTLGCLPNSTIYRSVEGPEPPLSPLV